MNFTQKTQTKITSLFANYAKVNSPGFAVGILYGNEVVFNQGFGQASLEHKSPINFDTVFDVGSMAKQFVGMAIALLEEAGQLSVKDNIRNYLPEFPDYGSEITIANLLYHTSGIRNYTVLAYYMIGYHESDAITKEEILNLLVRLRSTNFSPGEKWEYSDSNYFLLAEIIGRITGKTLGTYARDEIFTPLNMSNTQFRECHSKIIPNRAVSYVTHPIAFRSPYSYRNHEDTSNEFHTLVSNYEHVGAEGLFTTLEDLFQWDNNFRANRLGKGNTDLIARVLSPGARINNEIGYGYGINIGEFKGRKFYGHDGAIHGYTSSMMHFPDQNVTIACLSNHNLEGAWEYRDRIMDLIFPAGNSKLPARVPNHSFGADQNDQRIIGDYQNPATASIWKIFYKDNDLYIRVNDNWEFRIYCAKPLFYNSVEPGVTLKVEIDSTDRIRAIQGKMDENTFTLLPFLNTPLSVDELSAYTGLYQSDELSTSFRVTIFQGNLLAQNVNRHFCSMDLIYSPTTKDNFIAYDPHPISSQITFLRDDDHRINAFVYRDYDGDGREAFRFIKSKGEINRALVYYVH